MRPPIRAVIVDDEAPARANMHALLTELPGVDVIAECVDIPELDALLELRHVDVVFLDISMRGTTGIQWCRERSHLAHPRVVFVTAHSPHAIEAFDLDALDYVLKPVRLSRLARAVERVRQSMAIEPRHAAGGRIPIRYSSREVLVSTDEIVWLQADGNYVKVHEADQWHLVRASFESFLQRLGPDFVRTHRSVAVRASAVREIRIEGAAHIAVTRSGAEIPISRRRIASVRRLIRKGG